MATCSNMADPVLLFQLPEMDVRLEKWKKLCVKLWNTPTFTCTNDLDSLVANAVLFQF